MTKQGRAYIAMLEAHKGQKRWDGRDYSDHPIKVVKILSEFGIFNEDILSAAYLHDVLEDTKVSEVEIGAKFGEKVLGLVKELTFEDSQKDDDIYYKQCQKLSKDARLIKIADILANLTDYGKKSNHFISKRITALGILIDTPIPHKTDCDCLSCMPV